MHKVDHTYNIIELRDVTFAYTNENDPAVKDITFNIHKGDYLGIVGPNGGGKSTLLKLMLGLLKYKTGSIKLFGKEVNQFKDWSKIGYISQYISHVDPNFPMTVEEVVMMGRYPKLGLFHFPARKDKKIVDESLAQVEMLDYKHQLIGDLSGGQKQRVFIAKVLAGQPEVIMLDEPTTGVDIKTQKQFYALLQKLNKELDLTLILVTHEFDIVAREATEIAYINGELIYCGVPEKFMHSEYFEKLIGKGVNNHV